MARLRVSIVFESGARIGPGKAKLLESIRDTGSISAAAREMGMSYKRAWLLLDSMNKAFTELVVRAAPGGAGGGGASLTAFGAELLERYNRILHDASDPRVVVRVPSDPAIYPLGASSGSAVPSRRR
jgi:molybdate transport system regulatory protein